MIGTFLSFCAVGTLWGATNPFLREGAQSADGTNGCTASDTERSGEAQVQDSGSLPKRVLAQLFRAFARWRFLAPFLLNQLGSVLYYYLLGEHPISVAVPAANSIAFAVTAVVEQWRGGVLPNPVALLGGAACVICGVGLCLSAGDR
eukprot:gnl/TRDRNA2_/TRDRNA2_186303_c0_seq1.p1 gnl/TRDRNA2_/TRDRNA2_186303_c0~~gnl/TRDRNA2_/TRDRNA2_186303_c0_seq1.p1  ORF type:complete len:147 (+),score=17.98 gnl/TRDRNA2_/TRDRNA2_186303_c0_seq1:128-568(+)